MIAPEKPPNPSARTAAPQSEYSVEGREYRLVVTGGRDYRDREAVFRQLSACRRSAARTGMTLVVIHGGCPTGADYWASLWCQRKGVLERRYDADWKRYGISAGPRRNEEMLALEQPDMVLAFPGGRGTADCVRRARARGLLVITHDHRALEAKSAAAEASR